MAQLITIYPKTVTWQGYQMTTSQDMRDALDYLSQQNPPYTGSLNWGLLNGVMTPWLTLVSPYGTGSGTAYPNDWIILQNGVIASVMRADQYDVFYSSTP